MVTYGDVEATMRLVYLACSDQLNLMGKLLTMMMCSVPLLVGKRRVRDSY